MWLLLEMVNVKHETWSYRCKNLVIKNPEFVFVCQYSLKLARKSLGSFSHLSSSSSCVGYRDISGISGSPLTPVNTTCSGIFSRSLHFAYPTSTRASIRSLFTSSAVSSASTTPAICVVVVGVAQAAGRAVGSESRRRRLLRLLGQSGRQHLAESVSCDSGVIRITSSSTSFSCSYRVICNRKARCLHLVGRIIVVQSSGQEAVLPASAVIMRVVRAAADYCAGYVWVGRPKTSVLRWRSTWTQIRGWTHWRPVRRQAPVYCSDSLTWLAAEHLIVLRSLHWPRWRADINRVWTESDIRVLV